MPLCCRREYGVRTGLAARTVGPYLKVLRLPDPHCACGRVHLDVMPYPGDDHAAEVARLLALGAQTAESAKLTCRGVFAAGYCPP